MGKHEAYAGTALWDRITTQRAEKGMIAAGNTGGGGKHVDYSRNAHFAMGHTNDSRK